MSKLLLFLLFLPFTAFSQLSYINDINSHYFYEGLNNVITDDTIPNKHYDAITLNSIIRERVPIVDTVFADYVLYINKHNKIRYKENPQIERTKIYTKNSNYFYEYRERLLFTNKTGQNNETTYH